MAGLTFRNYQSSDYEQVMLLHKAALIHANAYTGEGPWDNDLLEIENHYLNNNGWFVIGETDGQLITMGALRRIDDRTAEIKRMRTQPAMQGKGIGKKILELLINKAKELGYTEIILETSDRQSAALKIYTNSGFMAYQSENIRGLNCTWYRKDITRE